MILKEAYLTQDKNVPGVFISKALLKSEMLRPSLRPTNVRRPMTMYKNSIFAFKIIENWWYCEEKF